MIIDSDTHVVESESIWKFLEPLEEKYRPIRVESKTTAIPSSRFFVIGGKPVPAPQADDPDLPTGVKELTDVPTRLKIMDEMGVDTHVIYPTLFLRPITDDVDILVALCGSYNRFLADVWSRSNGRLRWVVVPPLLDLTATAEQMEFGRDNGACGVLMRGVEGRRYLSDPYFDPVYAKAAALDIPVCVHIGNGGSFIQDNLIGGSFFFFRAPLMAAFVELMMARVPSRFPGLRIGFLEAGSEWLPYLVSEVRRRENLFGTKVWEGRGSILRENRMYVACHPYEDLPEVIKTSGSDNLITGTDFGHKDPSTAMDTFAAFRKMGGLSEATGNKIMSDNARSFYGI
jgi:predicted TIM-barrel fold metal-dependent hydrolase